MGFTDNKMVPQRLCWGIVSSKLEGPLWRKLFSTLVLGLSYGSTTYGFVILDYSIRFSVYIKVLIMPGR